MTTPAPKPNPPLPPEDEVAPPDQELRPAVASRSSRTPSWVVGGGAAVLGLAVFLWLSGHRQHQFSAEAAVLTTPTAPATAANFATPVPPPELLAVEAAGVTPPPAPASWPQPVLAHLQSAPPPMTPAPSPSGAADATAGRKSPALVVDLGEASAAVATTSDADGKVGGKESRGLSSEESFAARIGSAGETDRARATMLRNQSSTVPQGTMIPGVLETALNSDLPGFVRAVVSRDVRSFDGSTVLIPRGSRVIGQYKSGVALGQSRAFVIWSRILRPDGASIQIASSGADALGRAGMTGDVDRHFFQRFGGAILLSVLNAGVASIGDEARSTQVVIGSAQDASGLASSALTPSVIAPTVKVPQGSPIRIFVARDLDFSSVGGTGE